MKMIHMNVPGSEKATLEGYILDCEITFGQEKKRPAILICPGGGYLYCSPREAEPIALRYAAAGFHAFILRYSTGWDAPEFTPLKEVSWAIGYLRDNAEEWNIDPEKIATCGFSAGGHLALSAGILGQNKPNAMILGYPAASAPNLPGVNFMLKLLVGRPEVTDEDAKRFDLVAQITKEAPPVFLAATAEDLLTNYGAMPVAQKYMELGLGYELHIFQFGPHGYSLADATSADGSFLVMDEAFAQWHNLSVQWLLKTFGKPEFTDKSTSKMAGYLREMGLISGETKSGGFA